MTKSREQHFSIYTLISLKKVDRKDLSQSLKKKCDCISQDKIAAVYC